MSSARIAPVREFRKAVAAHWSGISFLQPGSACTAATSAKYPSSSQYATGDLSVLCIHRDTHERHRELAMTPLAAWQLAKKDGRSALRPPPKRPWWPDFFSQRSTVKVQPDGRAAAGTARLRSQAPPGTRLVHCLHPNGDISILAIPQFTPSNRKSSSTFPPPEKTLRLGSQAFVRLCSPSHTVREIG